MERDLTVGKPITAILKYTLPLFGSIIFQQLYNIADSLVAGRYIGTDALAAVGNGYEITLLFIAVAFGCNIGTSVITARYFGKKDIRGVKTTVSTAIIVSTVIAVILTALGLGLTKPLLNLIKTDPVIFTDSYEYLMIYLGGYIFLLSYNIATGIFSALGDSLTPFLFLAASSVTNVIVDIVFVKTLHMGVKGVAWATFLCQGVSAILALAFMFVRLRKLPHEGDEKIKKSRFQDSERDFRRRNPQHFATGVHIRRQHYHTRIHQCVRRMGDGRIRRGNQTQQYGGNVGCRAWQRYVKLFGAKHGRRKARTYQKRYFRRNRYGRGHFPYLHRDFPWIVRAVH